MSRQIKITILLDQEPNGYEELILRTIINEALNMYSSYNSKDVKIEIVEKE